MTSIKEIKQEIRHREWSTLIQESQSSGMSVKEWCQSKGIKLGTYYSRLKIVREEALTRQPELHSIVPVSISAEISDIKTENIEKENPSDREKIIIRKNGIEIEMPCSSSESTITAMLRGLKEC